MNPVNRYCAHCSNPIIRRVPEGDSRLRDCCDACGAIHYVNPRIIVGTLPVLGHRILLCKRAIEPRLGFWTLPAGFMELGETTAEGAARETREEAGANMTLGPLYAMIDVVAAEQLHIFYLGTLQNEHFDPGPESLEVRLFTHDTIPWDDLAFQTVRQTLRWYLDDVQQGELGFHHGALAPVHNRSS